MYKENLPSSNSFIDINLIHNF